MVQEAIHEEIKWLEERLEARKQELSESGEIKHEKEIVREAIREAAQTPPPTPSISDDAALQTVYDLKEKEHEHIIEELISLALAKGLASAMKVANSLKNPHLLDEFHDALADKYYEKLLDSRKLK